MIATRSLIALVTSVVLAPAVLFMLRQFRLVDVPVDRSSHNRPIPRGGGLAPMVGAVVAATICRTVIGHDLWLSLITAAVGFGLLGLIEDIHGLPPLTRLVLQGVIAGAVLPWVIHDLRGSIAWRVLFGGGVLAALVAYVNAFNFMDGIDGMAVAQVVVAGTTWSLIALHEHLSGLATGSAIVTLAAVGFAPFNFPLARMFLGDVGSYFLGGWLAVLAIAAVRSGVAPEAVLGPVAVALTDTGVTLVRRLIKGDTWYLPHHQHVYQKLTERGWSHPTTTLVVATVMVACSSLGALSLVGSAAIRTVADVAMGLTLVTYAGSPILLDRAGMGRRC